MECNKNDANAATGATDYTKTYNYQLIKIRENLDNMLISSVSNEVKYI